ncbi:MAG: DUF4136 domain-containing protein [Reichenbachiella sp.]|uniref:DUF4136 domain-containing protein n=1 Tax=Reichenbachiella sp. TaxID=2184521 RepID=UPI003266E8E3
MKPTFSLLIILLLCQTCASPKVIKFLNDELDYSQYKTYRLINYKSDDKSYDEQGLQYFNQIEKVINQNMTDRGYQSADKPDLITRYELVSTTTTANNNNRNYDPYGYNSFNSPSGWNSERRTEGVILIELRDKKRKKLVWQGSLDLKYSKREDPETTITELINHIFETYPYQAGSNEKIISN